MLSSIQRLLPLHPPGLGSNAGSMPDKGASNDQISLDLHLVLCGRRLKENCLLGLKAHQDKFRMAQYHLCFPSTLPCVPLAFPLLCTLSSYLSATQHFAHNARLWTARLQSVLTQNRLTLGQLLYWTCGNSCRHALWHICSNATIRFGQPVAKAGFSLINSSYIDTSLKIYDKFINSRNMFIKKVNTFTKLLL